MQKLRKKIIKDYRFPFKFTDDEYFSYFMDLYKNDFDLYEPWENMLIASEDLGGANELYDYSDNLHRTVIEDIKNKEAYTKFNTVNMPQIGQRNFTVSKRSPYHSDYEGLRLISIDLVKANFQVMKKYDPEIVNKSSTYLEFISKFTPYKYFQESKQIRQIIFGNLNPKRQQAFQRRHMEDIMEVLVKFREDFTFHGLTSDEVFLYIQNQSSESLLAEIEQCLIPLNLDIRVELFQLVSLGRKCFVKEYLSADNQVSKIEFKGVPGHLYPQAFKHYYKLPLNDKDMTFIFEGEKARLLNKAFEK